MFGRKPKPSVDDRIEVKAEVWPAQARARVTLTRKGKTQDFEIEAHKLLLMLRAFNIIP